MEPAEYVAALRKHWLLIAVLAALGLAGGYAWSAQTPPSYRATASVYVTVPQSASVGELVQGSTYAQQRIGSYAQLATKPYVLDRVIAQLGLDTTSRALARSVSATTPLDTVILEISAVDGDPRRAAAVADAVSSQLATAVDQLEGAAAADAPHVQITLVAAADVPVHPFAPNKRLDAATGMVLGAVLGVGVALARVVLDTRVRSVKDVRRVTDAPVLSTVRYDRRRRRAPLVVRDDPFGDRAEAYRRLRTNLRFLTVGGPSQSIVVTSALPGEGKTTAAVNLATAMAETGTRVLLVDADLRRPSVSTYLGLEGGVGLTTVLIGEAEVGDVVQRWGAQLDVLPAGQVPPNPSELLDSATMATVLAQLAQRYDVILLDCAPLLPVTDAAALARVTDGALVVVGCRTVRRGQLADALTALEAVGARVLGLLLNQVPARESTVAVTYGSTPRATARASRAAARRRAAVPAGSPPGADEGGSTGTSTVQGPDGVDAPASGAHASGTTDDADHPGHAARDDDAPGTHDPTPQHLAADGTAAPAPRADAADGTAADEHATVTQR